MKICSKLEVKNSSHSKSWLPNCHPGRISIQSSDFCWKKNQSKQIN